MKGLALSLALCAIGLAQADQVQLTRSGNICHCNPEEASIICAQDQTDSLLIVHENCNQFYKCNHGQNVSYFCPSPLLYNPLAEVCDWPGNVDCGGRPVVLVPETDDNDIDEGDHGNNGTTHCDPSQAPAICAADGSSGTVVAHENCNQYYMCALNKPVTFSCANGLVYNPYTAQCDWPFNVDCGDKPIIEIEDWSPDVCICDPSQAPEICATAEDGTTVAHEICNQFYECINGVPVAQTCPHGLLFNPCIRRCDSPQNVECIDRPIVEQEPENENENGESVVCNCNPEEAPAICKEDGSDGVLIAHEKCNKFYKCANGINEPLSCPGDLLYNPKLQICDWPQNVECGDRPIGSGGDGNGEDSNGDENNDENGNDQDDNSEDSNGEDGNGGGSGDTGTCNCNPEEAPAICKEEGSDGVLVAHEKCNKFYKCAYGINVPLSCPGDLLYNPKLQICDWPQNVECGDRPIGNGGNGEDSNGENGNDQDDNSEDSNGEDGNGGGSGDTGTCNCNPEEAPAICKEEGSDGVLIAHEKCNKFYKCANGINVPLSCPGDLLYNPKLEICDWPQNVECGDRPIGNGGNGEDSNGENGNDQDDNSEDSNDEDGNGGGSGDTGTCNCNPEEAPAICKEEGSDGVLVAHEKCNKFYKCAYGINVPLSCPGDLLYNPKLQICDWPQNVECGDRPIGNGGNGEDSNGENGNDQDDNSEDSNGEDGNGGGSGDTGTCNCNPEEAPAICKEEGSDGVLVAHEKCNKFYKCAYGINVPLSCPGDLLYNPKLQICDWPQNVECEDRPIGNGGNGEDSNGENGNDQDDNSEDSNGEDGNGGGSGDTGTCNCNPEEAPAICKEDGSDGVLIAHEKCNKFYKCANGINVPLSCPGDLLYNPKLEICDWPQNVECGDRPIGNGGDGNGEDSNGENGNDQDDNGEDSNGEGGNGGESGDTGTCNCNPEEAPAICKTDGSDGVLIAHEKCNKFYKCDGGINVPLSCPGDLLYNPKLQICDWPQNVQCGDRLEDNQPEEAAADDVCTDGEGEDIQCNCIPEEAPRICRGALSSGLLIAHENCNQFYQCAHGVPVTVSCRNGLLFNIYIQRCDWPHNVDCGDRPIVEIESEQEEDDKNDDQEIICNCDPAEAPAICSSGDSEGVVIAHEICNKFYKCSFGSPLALSCSGALLYNPYIEACDWPYNVDCGDREILQPEPEQEIGAGGGDNNVTVEAHCDPSQAPAICATAGSNGVLVAHEYCNQYYVCASGAPVALSCNPNLLFNPANGQCDWPSNVECGDRIIVEPEVDVGPCLCEARQAPSICAGSDSNGKMIAHEACDQYYICFNGTPIARSCPRGLFYEPHTRQCNSPAQVSCDGRDATAHLSINKHMLAQTRFF